MDVSINGMTVLGMSRTYHGKLFGFEHIIRVIVVVWKEHWGSLRKFATFAWIIYSCSKDWIIVSLGKVFCGIVRRVSPPHSVSQITSNFENKRPAEIIICFCELGVLSGDSEFIQS